MKSICIKTSNQKTTEYLLEQLNNFKLDDIYFSCKKFKIYQNIIIHFKGKNENLFCRKLSKMISRLIIDLYEDSIVRNLIKSEYFYFDSIEQQQIANITFEGLYDKEESIYNLDDRINIIYKPLYNYLKQHRSLVLKGFITFRLRGYLEALLEQIDKSVNKFIVQREYTEFISLLRVYVNSEPPSCNEVHLVYHNFKPILFDENKNIIKIEDDFNAKYLSDISFSSNDYALNTLLNIIPKKINIHLIDENEDEFINTIKLIFEDRIKFCNNCAICKIYKKNHAIQT